MRKTLFSVILCAVSSMAFAETAVPHTFTAGTAAKASEVNNNFTTLANAINSLASRVNKIEGGNLTASDLAATYTWTGLQIGLGNSPIESIIETIAFTGSITLSSNSTFSYSINNDSSALSTTGTATTPPNTTPITTLTSNTAPYSGTGSWSINKNAVTLTLFSGQIINFVGTAGGRSLVGITVNLGTLLDRQLIVLSRNN